MYDPASGLNSLGTFYDNKKIIQLLADAKGTIDKDDRASDFSEVQQMGLDDAPAVPLYFTKSIDRIPGHVQNFQTYPIGWWNLREVWLSK